MSRSEHLKRKNLRKKEASKKSSRRTPERQDHLDNQPFAPIRLCTVEEMVPIYCEMNGVLCDYRKGVKNLMRERGEPKIKRAQKPRAVREADGFYQNLPWKPDGQALWTAIRGFQPILLSQVAGRSPSIMSREKAEWCRRELQGIERINHWDMVKKTGKATTYHALTSSSSSGHGNDDQNDKNLNLIHLVTCREHMKWKECRVAGSILIDSSARSREQWEQAGGRFLLHTETSTTLRQLLALLSQPTRPAVPPASVVAAVPAPVDHDHENVEE